MNILEGIAQLQALAAINPHLVLVTKNECEENGTSIDEVSEIGPVGIIVNRKFHSVHIDALETKHAKVVMIQ